MSLQRLTIRLRNTGELLVDASADQVRRLEGNYYVHPDGIRTGGLEVSDRVYRCPVKGISYWVDLKTARGWLNDICWIYPQPEPDYAAIAGWYGFRPEHERYEAET